MLDQHRNVVTALAKWRRMDRNHVEAIEEVFAKQSLAHQLPEIAMGCGDDPGARLDRHATADAQVLALLQHPEQPGLGLGLREAPGSQCRGLCLTSEVELPRGAALDALWEREMWTGIYRPRWVRLQTGGKTVDAIAFVVDPDHPQFAGDLPVADQAARIARAGGAFGSCRDYLAQTVRALDRHGCPDPALAALLELTDRGAD